MEQSMSKAGIAIDDWKLRIDLWPRPRHPPLGS